MQDQDFELWLEEVKQIQLRLDMLDSTLALGTPNQASEDPQTIDGSESDLDAEVPVNLLGIYIAIQDRNATSEGELGFCQGHFVKVTQSSPQFSGINLVTEETGLVDLDLLVKLSPELLAEIIGKRGSESIHTPLRDTGLAMESEASFLTSFTAGSSPPQQLNQTHCIEQDSQTAPPSIFFSFKPPRTIDAKKVQKASVWFSGNNFERGVPLFFDYSSSSFIAFAEATHQKQGILFF